MFIWAPEEEGQFQPGRCSRWWLHESLGALEQDLQALGTSLVYRRATDSRAALVDMVQAIGAQALFFNHLYDPISLVRDNEVKFAMQELGVRLPLLNQEIHSPNPLPFCWCSEWNRLLHNFLVTYQRAGTGTQ